MARILQITLPLLESTTKIYNKLRQKNIKNYIQNLLQITAALISQN